MDTDNIFYIYSALGEKLAKRMKDNSYNYYAGSMVYNHDKSLKYILFEEGLVNKSSGAFTYEYHLKDHLGNTRVTFQPNWSGTTTTQMAEYYPFGSSYLPISPAGTNKYLYNGKEKQDDVLSGTALDWYDYGARFYDPSIGRFMTKDPLMEWHFNATPYHYCFNNPINLIDPLGLDTLKVDPDTNLPHKDLPQVDVTAKKPNGWQKFWSKIERALARLGEPGSGETQEGGWSMNSSIGQGTPNKAKYTEDIGNIDALMPMLSSATAGSFKPGALDPAKIIKLVIGIAKETKTKSDKNIKEANGDKTDTNGQSIKRTDSENKASEAGSIVVPLLYEDHPDEGFTYVQDYKISKYSRDADQFQNLIKSKTHEE